MLRIGTCSWKYPSWYGMVYSSPEPGNYLAEYSETYKTVEIDQWFWSLFGPDSVKMPDPTAVQEYESSVGDDFRFTIKAANSITLTHVYSKTKKNAGEPNPLFLSTEHTRRFLDTISPLQNKVDGVIFQFEYLNRRKAPDMMEFIDRLERFFASLPDGWLYAVELRNPNFLKRPYFEMLYRQGIIHVFSEGYYMPSITEIYRYYADTLIPRSILRLMGTAREKMDQAAQKRWDRRIAPKDEDLHRIAGMIREMIERRFHVTVNVNNHYEGSAPRTIEGLQKYLAP